MEVGGGGRRRGSGSRRKEVKGKLLFPAPTRGQDRSRYESSPRLGGQTQTFCQTHAESESPARATHLDAPALASNCVLRCAGVRLRSDLSHSSHTGAVGDWEKDLERDRKYPKKRDGRKMWRRRGDRAQHSVSDRGGKYYSH